METKSQTKDIYKLNLAYLLHISKSQKRTIFHVCLLYNISYIHDSAWSQPGGIPISYTPTINFWNPKLSLIPQQSSYSANPFSLITSTTLSTYFRQTSSLSASTITLTTGSVPDSRTRILPVSPRASATCCTAAWTSASSWRKS